MVWKGRFVTDGLLHPLRGNQREAVAPDRDVWLSASAGTGKTQVLTARVFRLLRGRSIIWSARLATDCTCPLWSAGC